jgi:hypothetical protein
MDRGFDDGRKRRFEAEAGGRRLEGGGRGDSGRMNYDARQGGGGRQDGGYRFQEEGSRAPGFSRDDDWGPPPPWWSEQQRREEAAWRRQQDAPPARGQGEWFGGDGQGDRTSAQQRQAP